jgi:hypothetical protein
MSFEIAIEIEKAVVEEYKALAEQNGIELEDFELKRFDGGVAIVAVVLPLMSATLPFITKMVVAQIEAKRHVKVKVKGVELQGLTAAEAGRILAQLSDQRSKPK